jgi:hypothetical protein
MHPALKALIAVTVIAIIIVVYRSQSQADEQSGWAQYGAAEAKGMSVEALESARDQAKGTSAEPWIAYELAMKLCTTGGHSNLDRSKQIAQETLSNYPDHPVAEWLKKLVAVADSFAGVPDKT